MNHIEVWEAENHNPAATWETWISKVEAIAGIDADGNLSEDGYSLDTFLDMFEAGWTPKEAAEATEAEHLSMI